MEYQPTPPPRLDVFPIGGSVEHRPASGRRAVLVAAVVLLAVGGVAAFAFLSQGSSGGFPDSALGYQRLRDSQSEQVEAAMADIRIGEIEIRTALYGEGGEPRLLAATYENYPEGANAESIIQGVAAGAEASGGTLDEASLQVSESNGYRFACMSGGGPGFLVPGGPSQQGVMCVFQGELVGVMVTTHTRNSVLGLMDVRAFVEAYEAA